MEKTYQLISPETLNVSKTLLTITELTQMKSALKVLISGGAASFEGWVLKMVEMKIRKILLIKTYWYPNFLKVKCF